MIGTVLALERHRARLPAVGASTRSAGASPRCASGSPALHGFFVHKWYFDELIDRSSCGRSRWFGRFARDVFERVVIDGAVRRRHVGRGARRLGRGARRPVRLPAPLRRAAARRRHRPRPLLPDRRLVTIHLSILLFFPLALGAARRAAAARRSRRSALLVGSLVALAYAVLLLFDFETGVGRAAVRDRRRVDRRAGHPLHARRRRAQPVADRADHAAVRGLGAVDHAAPAGGPAPSSSRSTWAWRRPPCSARSSRRT